MKQLGEAEARQRSEAIVKTIEKLNGQMASAVKAGCRIDIGIQNKPREEGVKWITPAVVIDIALPLN